MKGHESVDESVAGAHVVGNGFDGPRAASSCETATRLSAARANARGRAAQSPTRGALPAPPTRQAHPFLHFFSCSSCWMLASQAWAIIDKGICRYQLCQKRTSYSSSPTSPLASSLHCSTVERLEATRTFVSNDVLAGT